MARYTGPRQKKARRFKEPIFGPTKVLERKPYAPGQHGRGRTKKTAYAVQLESKQKAKYIYGLLERQFRKVFEAASRKKGVTGDNLLQALESRLDNTVFRLGIVRTRRQARQLVLHGHVTVNEQVVNVPSYHCQPGDVIALRPKSKDLVLVKDAIDNASKRKLPWLEFDRKTLAGKFIAMPEVQDIPENINVQHIVELYSK
jgi:small subunit ribosomal protein S4